MAHYAAGVDSVGELVADQVALANRLVPIEPVNARLVRPIA
jgi:hypothetical protein